MSIHKNRSDSLAEGRFQVLKPVYCEFLENVWVSTSYYPTTFGKKLKEYPLQSLQRWVRSPTTTLRNWYLRNKRIEGVL